jgi:hypothetical protein
MSPVREKGRHKVSYRLGADSSISLQRSSRLRLSLTIVTSCPSISVSIRSISLYSSASLAAHRYLSSSVRSTPSLFDPCPSTLLVDRRFLNRRFIHHCLIIPDWKRRLKM